MSVPIPLPLFHVVGFSGHRQVDQPAESAGAIKAVLEALRREGTGEWVALSSVAAGADTLFTQSALELGLAWHALLPLPAAEFRSDFSAQEWEVADALLPRAEQVRVITENGYRDYAHAAAQYQRLLELRPNSPEAYGSLGLIHRRQGRWEDAVASFRKALELDPHIGRYRSSLAEELLAARHFDEARAEYQRLVEYSSDDSSLAMFYEFQTVFTQFLSRGSIQEGNEWFGRFKPQPADEDTFIAIQKLWARNTGDFATALRLDGQQRYFEKFTTPHWQQDVDTAWDYLGNDDVEGCRSRLQKLLPDVRAESAKQPRNTTVWAYLGSVEAALGNRDQALAAAQKLAELVPEATDAVTGPDLSRTRAEILAWAGEKDEAIAELSRLLRVPYGANVNLARVDPGWLPLRDDPRFKALLADPKNNEPLF